MFGSRPNVKSQIIFLVVVLVVVLFMILATRTGFLKFGEPPLRVMPSFEGNAVVDEGIYYNKTYLFGLHQPTERWQILTEKEIGEKPDFGFHSSILDQAHWIARFVRYSDKQIWGEVYVASFLSDTGKTAAYWAKQLLSEITANFSPQDSLVITQDVVTRGREEFQSAFFMVELPESDKIKYPVVIPFFRARENYAIGVFCRARFDTYGVVKGDFEKILTSFEWYRD